MPLYEYVCLKCGKKTEVIQRFSQRPPRACPHCKGKLKKSASAPAIKFKGSGWYINDYAKPKEGKSSSTGESSDKSEKSEKSEKSDKSEKSEKSDKSEKSEKSQKSETSGKAEKVEKKEKKAAKD